MADHFGNYLKNSILVFFCDRCDSKIDKTLVYTRAYARDLKVNKRWDLPILTRLLFPTMCESIYFKTILRYTVCFRENKPLFWENKALFRGNKPLVEWGLSGRVVLWDSVPVSEVCSYPRYCQVSLVINRNFGWAGDKLNLKKPAWYWKKKTQHVEQNDLLGFPTIEVARRKWNAIEHLQFKNEGIDFGEFKTTVLHKLR